MKTEYNIDIYDYSNKLDKSDVMNIFRNSFKLNKMVPIIGSGFSAGLKTLKGTVPSVSDLKEEIISFLSKIGMIQGDQIINEECSLNDISTVFWEYLNKNEYKSYRKSFQRYVEENFTEVKKIDQGREDFIKSKWKYIITFNYDDAIEQALESVGEKCNVLIPYEDYSIENDRIQVIKIHGDAKQYAQKGNSKYIVISQTQYVDLIRDKNNEYMQRALEDTFLSMDILFLGCSLENELDILMSAGMCLNNKASEEKDHHIIYVAFNNNFNLLKLKSYGITDIVCVDTNSLNSLYADMYSVSKEIQMIHCDDEFKDYTNIRVNQLSAADERNKDFLFLSTKTRVRDNSIEIPGFFINRNLGNQIKESIIKCQKSIHIVHGRNLSGKTYLLIQLLKILDDRKIYFFDDSVKLGDDAVGLFDKYYNSVFLLDEGVISSEQFNNIIVNRIDEYRKNQIHIVLVINRSDMDFYKSIKSINHSQIELIPLDNTFNDKERNEINRVLGKSRILDYKENETILDFISRNDDAFLKKTSECFLPDASFLRRDKDKEVTAMIMLATASSISVTEANEYAIDEAVYGLINKYNKKMVQKEYLYAPERHNNAYSSFKFVCNSRYWAIKCLSEFASNKENYQAIMRAYENILGTGKDKSSREKNRLVKKYCMLDKIQVLFSNKKTKGSLMLPFMIYEHLHSIMYDNFHFLHQEAKCELRMAYKYRSKGNNNQEVLDNLDKANRNITRAIELAKEVYANNIDFTVAHMYVTRALININYCLCGNNDRLSNTIKFCYDIFVRYIDLCPTLRRDEIKVVNEFIKSNNWHSNIKGEDRRMLDDISSLIYTNRIKHV